MRLLLVRIALSPLLCVFLCAIAHGQSQITLTLNVSPNPSPYVSDWTNRKENASITVVVGAGNKAQQAKFKAELYRDDALIARTKFASMPVVTLPAGPGAQTWFGESIFPYAAVEFVGKVDADVIKTGMLPSGSYKLCLELVSIDGRLSLAANAPVCAQFMLTDYELPTLLSPENNAELKPAERPTFRWTPLSPAPRFAVKYRFMLFELLDGMKAPQAMKQRPIFEKEVVGLTQLPWPPEFTLPSRVKQCVWTIKTVDERGNAAGRNSGFSEPFSMKIIDAAEAAKAAGANPKSGGGPGQTIPGCDAESAQAVLASVSSPVCIPAPILLQVYVGVQSTFRLRFLGFVAPSGACPLASNVFAEGSLSAGSNAITVSNTGLLSNIYPNTNSCGVACFRLEIMWENGSLGCFKNIPFQVVVIPENPYLPTLQSNVGTMTCPVPDVNVNVATNGACLDPVVGWTYRINGGPPSPSYQGNAFYPPLDAPGCSDLSVNTAQFEVAATVANGNCATLSQTLSYQITSWCPTVGGKVAPAFSRTCATTTPFQYALSLQNFRGCILRWEMLPPGSNSWVPLLSNAASYVHSFSSLPAPGTCATYAFRAIVKNGDCGALAGSSCLEAASEPALVTVCTSPRCPVIVVAQPVCAGQPVLMSAAGQSVGILTWKKNNTTVSVSGPDLAGSGGPHEQQGQFATIATVSPQSWTVTMQDPESVCPPCTSSPVTIQPQVLAPPVISGAPPFLCMDQSSASLTASQPAPPAATYTWFLNAMAIGVANPLTAQQPGNYTVLAEGQACHDRQKASVQIADASLEIKFRGECCLQPGSSLTAMVSGPGATMPLQYQWSVTPGTLPSPANTKTCILLQDGLTHTYTVVVSNTYCSESAFYEVKKCTP